MSDPNEIAVISEVLDGNQEQYRLLVERYHQGLIQHLYNLMHDQASAEDVAQEAFIRAYTKLSQYNQAYAFSTWLYKIADNLALRQLKKSRPTKDIAELEEVIPDERPLPIEAAAANFTKEAVGQAIQTLPLAYQQVVTMYYWDNFNYEQIAVITNHPVGTIKTWLFRAKQQLRKELYGQV